MRIFRRITLLTSIIPIRKYTIVETHLKGHSAFKPMLLTFDDGPNHIDSVTMELLQVLKKHNVKVCFCLIGKNVKEHPHIVKQMFEDGHILGNHGHSEKLIIFQNINDVPKEIEDCNHAIREAIGKNDHVVEYYRPSYGAYFPKHKPVWESLNMRLLPVTDFYFDHKVDRSGMDKYISHFIKNVKKNYGGVYVMHDGRNVHSKIAAKVAQAKTINRDSDFDRSWVPTAIDKIITELKSEGFIFPLLDEHPNQLNETFRQFLHAK
jgi:peptidoglycan-N-acetylglucosamine deacetylase